MRHRACTHKTFGAHVCLAPNSGVRADILGPSLWDMNGLMRRSKGHLYSVTFSARPSSEGGTARRSALADDKLGLRRRLHPSRFALRKPPTTGSR